jgi:hypothetical protein
MSRNIFERVATIRGDYEDPEDWHHYDRRDMRSDILELCDALDRIRDSLTWSTPATE